MPENKTRRGDCTGAMAPRGDRSAPRDFIPLEEAWENFASETPPTKIEACDLCLRVRLFSVRPDFICQRMIETKTRHCLAKFYKSAQRLD